MASRRNPLIEVGGERDDVYAYATDAIASYCFVPVRGDTRAREYT